MMEQLALWSSLCNAPTRSEVVQGSIADRTGTKLVQFGVTRESTVVQHRRPGFTFYATFDVDSLCSYIPASTSILLPASSWSRYGLKKPTLPAGIVDLAADSGGFVASRIWGEYRYSLEQYVTWLRSWSPKWSATMDYCCEPELGHLTRERQEKTTRNALEAWQRYQSAPWAWVPTIQGWTPEEYRRHASDLKPLLMDMQRYYAGNSAWRVGVGTLCHRNDVKAVQAILDAVRSVLPAVPLHLWGIKLDALRSITLDQVVSTDSAVWHGAMYAKNDIAELAAQAGMSMRRYKIMHNLPAYAEKVYAAVEESKRVQAAQTDTVLLSLARAHLKAQGWTINIRTRRNRQYVYASKRRGDYVEQRSICPVSELSKWLAHPVV